MIDIQQKRLVSQLKYSARHIKLKTKQGFLALLKHWLYFYKRTIISRIKPLLLTLKQIVEKRILLKQAYTLYTSITWSNIRSGIVRTQTLWLKSLSNIYIIGRAKVNRDKTIYRCKSIRKLPLLGRYTLLAVYFLERLN